MPTKNILLTVYLEDEDFAKMRCIAKEEACSLDDLLERIYKWHVQKYEQQYGKILLNTIKEDET